MAIWFCPFCISAQEQRVSQYSHRAWLVRDGFFSGAPDAITQTTDGYLWIGTQSGLYRFDGSRFELWSSPDGNKLPSNHIGALLGARDGSLWIGTLQGLAHFADGKLFVYPDFNNRVLGSLLEDPSGRIWFSSSDAGGALRTPICQALATKIRCLDQSDGITTQSCCAFYLAQDTEGYLWAATDGPLVRWKPGHSDSYLPHEWTRTNGLQTAACVVPMPGGSVLVCVAHPGPHGGLQRLLMGQWQPVKVPGFDGSKVTAKSAFRDTDGGIWLGTDEGIYRIHGNDFEKFGMADGLSGDYVGRFYQDRENGIWVTSSGGLDYFHPRKVTTFSKREGLTADNVDGVTVGHDNGVWLTEKTLDFLRNGQIDVIGPANGLPGRMLTASFEDSFGRFWCGIDHDLYRYYHGKFRRVHDEGGGATRFIVGITEDSAHDIWAEVSGHRRELIRVRDLEVVERYPEAVVPSARALAAGPGGVLWLGLRNGDLARFLDGHAEVFPSPGGHKSYVYQVVVNPDGSVFAATSAGLVGWKEGTSHLLSSKNGLPCDSVSGAAWDNPYALWLATGCGLATMSKEELDRWWRNDSAVLTPKMLDVFDGVQPGLANFNPMVRTSDGRLWIANNSTLQMFDPSHLTYNDVLPPVQIEKVVADRKPYQPNDKLTFPPLMLDLEIDYTALSFVNPRKVRFRYKLEGRDTEWQEAGTRRQAFYTDLPPSSYRFRVIASNDDGLWNEEGASIAFTIAPAWYQTTAFRLSCLFGGFLLLWLVYYLRMKQASRSIRARFDERIAERTQIARNLHDTLLQTIQGCKLVADQARSDLSDPTKTQGYLCRLSDWLDRASLEGRAALETIRIADSGTADLAGSIRSGIEELHAKCGLTISLDVQGSASKIHPVVRQEIFLIAYEALGNACRHSGGHNITVQLSHEGSLSLRIRDDGQGVDEQTLKAGKAGHFGLAGMRERAQRINATLKIWSDMGKGTEVVLIVPERMLFEASHRSGDSLFRKLINQRRPPQSERLSSEDEY